MDLDLVFQVTLVDVHQGVVLQALGLGRRASDRQQQVVVELVVAGLVPQVLVVAGQEGHRGALGHQAQEGVARVPWVLVRHRAVLLGVVRLGEGLRDESPRVRPVVGPLGVRHRVRVVLVGHRVGVPLPQRQLRLRQLLRPR